MGKCFQKETIAIINSVESLHRICWATARFFSEYCASADLIYLNKTDFIDTNKEFTLIHKIYECDVSNHNKSTEQSTKFPKIFKE